MTNEEKIRDYAKRLLKHEIITSVLILSEDEDDFTEFDLWGMANDKTDHGPDCDCHPEFLEEMKLIGELAVDAGGWWYHPIGEKYEYEFVETSSWTQMHQSWHLRREAKSRGPMSSVGSSKTPNKHHSN